jgi:hypothetical protein
LAAYIEAPHSPPTVKVWWEICFSRQTVSPRYLPNGSTVVRWWYDDTQRTCVLGTTEKFVFLLSCSSSQKLLQRMEGGANRTRSFWALKFTFAKALVQDQISELRRIQCDMKRSVKLISKRSGTAIVLLSEGQD